MTGLIWFVQVVHYPLFDTVGLNNFVNYETKHSQLTTYVVIVPMFIELITACLLIWRRPFFIGTEVWFAAALLGVIWLSTAFLQVPQHNILTNGFDVQAHQTLVFTNWIRTVAWSLRTSLVMYWLYKALQT